jgi:hypothetical protein
VTSTRRLPGYRAAGEHREQPAATQTSYIDASRRAARRRRQIGVAIAVVVVAAPILAVVALQQRSKATSESQRVHSQQLAASAEAILPADPVGALRRALEADVVARTPQSVDALRHALMHPHPLRVLRIPVPNAVRTASSADARHVDAEGYDGVVRRFDLTGGPGRRLGKAQGEATFSADAAVDRAVGLVAVAARGRATVKDARTRTVLLTLTRLGRGLEGAGERADLSPDGRYVVTSGHDSTRRSGSRTWRREWKGSSTRSRPTSTGTTTRLAGSSSGSATFATSSTASRESPP